MDHQGEGWLRNIATQRHYKYIKTYCYKFGVEIIGTNSIDRVEDLRHSYYGLNSSLYTIRESNIRLIYPNDYDVLCMVPLWNSTAGLRHHKRINVAGTIGRRVFNMVEKMSI